MRFRQIAIPVKLYCLLFYVSATPCFAQYRPAIHKKISGNEVPVTAAGNYANPGTTYVLANDITSGTSSIFLGKNVVLDLNGYTIKYADANYQHIANSGFEEGSKGWDFSKAPGAKVLNTADVHVFLGKKLLSLKAGDVITSSNIYLPVADRSYFAMCGITGRYYHDMKKYPDDEMKVSVYVEDEQGHEVNCVTNYGDTTLVSCPVEKKSPRLGGGFVYAHLNKLPAGKYRVRIKADTDCLVDEIDIRPAMDVGISIIENTTPLAHYDHLIRESYPPIIPAFFDYTGDIATGKPLPGLPHVEGEGSITIKNGVIETGAVGILSWGIQSSAANVKIILQNVKIKTSGISSGAADISWAGISNCSFDVNIPFLIQRHVNLCSVILRGERASEIEHNTFYGGQGCLSVKGKYSLVHDNLFVNNQTVTNHYSIMGTGDSSRIYNNRFEPKQGSGIYVSRYTEVFNNIFKIKTSAPTCEYGREEYSTAAVRLGDYHALPGSPRASVGNRIHDNQIFITAKNYPEPKEFIPMAWGIYYSASGGENYVYGNKIVVNKTDTSSKVLTAAFYICGGEGFGGEFYNNRITTNVPAAWVASFYGGASNSKIHNNTIIPLNHAKFKKFRMGSSGCDECVARNIQFRSNDYSGEKFDMQVTDQNHSYTVYWTLRCKVSDKKGRAVKNAEVIVQDKNDSVVLKTRTDVHGKMQTELPEYSVNGKEINYSSPYIVTTGAIEKKVELDRNTAITFVVSPKINHQPVSEFYNMKDYYTVKKFDAHVHVDTDQIAFIQQAAQDNFRLLTINWDDVNDPPPMEVQQNFALKLLKAFPERIAYATTFSIRNFNNDDWYEQTIAYLKNSFIRGAIAVKIYKVIGMSLRDRGGKLVMIDDVRFDPVIDFIEKNNIPVVGHLGEPKNCWLPVEKMTIKGDKSYFTEHPEYHMYLHPEFPSYEEQIAARDHMLEKHPHLKFVGAHLGSLEWSVDELAKRLDKFPNMAVDMAARISHLQYQATANWQKVHDFCIKYQDRLLYATDLLVDEKESPAAIKKQAHDTWLNDWRFFTTDEKMRAPEVEDEFKGLQLPREVIDKIYRINAEKWFPEPKRN